MCFDLVEVFAATQVTAYMTHEHSLHGVIPGLLLLLWERWAGYTWAGLGHTLDTRYVMLLHLPAGRDARLVEQAMRQAIGGLPGELARTITWDQGKEMAFHADFTIATGIPVYFCDPHKPWQRGSNENTNRLLRQHLPKGTDLSVHSAADLARIAGSLNNRPRKTLGYMTPSERLTESLAHTG